MKKHEQYEQIIIQTQQWFDKKIQQLNLLTEDKNLKIMVEGNDGEQIELPEELKKGFRFGIEIAIKTFGNFPIKIIKPDDSN